MVVDIIAKAWGYSYGKNEDILTGNYKVLAPFIEPKVDFWSGNEITHLEFEIVRIHQIGEVLEIIRNDKNVDYNPTDEEIIKTWNNVIYTHNANQELFIKKFSAKHKEYYVDLTKGYGNFFFTEDMIIEEREKAIKFNHPIVGIQWTPRACIRTYPEAHEERTEGYKKYIAKNGEPKTKEFYLTAYAFNSLRNL